MSLCESSQNVYLFSWETVLDSALCKFVSDVHQLNFMFFFMSVRVFVSPMDLTQKVCI